MTNILLSVQGTIGDLVMILRIGDILNTRGDSVTLVTHCAYESLVRQAGLGFVALDTPDEFQGYIQDVSLCETPRGNIEFQRRRVLPMSEREAALLSERADPDTILIGSHLFMLGPQLVAEKTGLPLVRMFPGAVNVARLFMFEMMYREVLAADINAIRARLGLPPISDWTAWVRYPQGNLGAWPGWFAPPEADWPEWLALALPGFLTMDELEQGEIPPELEDFLQSGAPPLLIAGSTGTFLNKKFYAACAEACRLSDRRGILVTRFPDAVPDPLPQQVKWFPRLPFASLMPRVAAAIHHGGLGTVARSIASGIPQLVLAAGSDRPDNAQRVQRLGVGEYLPPAQWNAERIAEALERLIHSPAVHERCREMAERMRADDPAAVVRNVVDGVVPKVSL